MKCRRFLPPDARRLAPDYCVGPGGTRRWPRSRRVFLPQTVRLRHPPDGREGLDAPTSNAIILGREGTPLSDFREEVD